MWVHTTPYGVWLSAFLFWFYLLHLSWLLVDYKGLQSKVNFSSRRSFEKTCECEVLSSGCEQTHLVYKVTHQAAATYHIWLICVHVVLSYHKTSALSLELWEDLRPVSLVFLCRSTISFSSEQFPFGSLCLWKTTSFSCSTRGETGLKRGCNEYRGSSIDVDIVDFGHCRWDIEHCRKVMRLWSTSGPEGTV